MDNLFLGIDGGGTKTLGVLADCDGKEHARCTAGASNPNVVGLETSAGRLIEVIDACCSNARVAPENIAATVVGLAGAGNEEQKERLTRLLCERYGPVFRFAIETDARIALEGALCGKPGLVVIAGTGSVVIVKSIDERIRLIGGWGRLLGDDGSGHFIGVEAAKAFVKDLETVAPAPAIKEVVAKATGWQSRDRVISSLYREQFEPSTLAPLVLDLATKGDEPSRAILRRGAMEIASQVAVGVRMFPDHAVNVATCGGLIDHPTSYRSILSEEILKAEKNATVVYPERSAIDGALLMAVGMR